MKTEQTERGREGELKWALMYMCFFSEWDAWMAHIASWVDFYTFWLKIFQGPVHVIYYNNLKTNTEDELNRAIEFLKLKPNPLLINCALHFPKSSYFKRKHSKPLVDKTSLFRLSMSKEKQAIHKFKELIVGRFGVESKLYKSLNLTISEAKLHGLWPESLGPASQPNIISQSKLNAVIEQRSMEMESAILLIATFDHVIK